MATPAVDSVTLLVVRSVALAFAALAFAMAGIVWLQYLRLIIRGRGRRRRLLPWHIFFVSTAFLMAIGSDAYDVIERIEWHTFSPRLPYTVIELSIAVGALFMMNLHLWYEARPEL